jgi:hypothetical protein
MLLVGAKLFHADDRRIDRHEEVNGSFLGFGEWDYKFHVLPTQCIYVFCVDLRTNSDYFPIQH